MVCLVFIKVGNKKALSKYDKACIDVTVTCDVLELEAH
jgi:hypothetical protein